MSHPRDGTLNEHKQTCPHRNELTVRPVTWFIWLGYAASNSDHVPLDRPAAPERGRLRPPPRDHRPEITPQTLETSWRASKLWARLAPKPGSAMSITIPFDSR